MAFFNVGDIVVLADAFGFGAGSLLQMGDRGTVIYGGGMSEFGVRVHWHRADCERSVVEDRLRLCVTPADPIREPPVDARPLISPLMQDENPEEWQRLWNLNSRDGQCDVCHEVPDIWDGPMNSNIPTRCTHWLCVECWYRIARRDRRCPTCRDDLSHWLQGAHPSDDEED